MSFSTSPHARGAREFVDLTGLGPLGPRGGPGFESGRTLAAGAIHCSGTHIVERVCSKRSACPYSLGNNVGQPRTYPQPHGMPLPMISWPSQERKCRCL